MLTTHTISSMLLSAGIASAIVVSEPRASQIPTISLPCEGSDCSKTINIHNLPSTFIGNLESRALAASPTATAPALITTYLSTQTVFAPIATSTIDLSWTTHLDGGIDTSQSQTGASDLLSIISSAASAVSSPSTTAVMSSPFSSVSIIEGTTIHPSTTSPHVSLSMPTFTGSATSLTVVPGTDVPTTTFSVHPLPSITSTNNITVPVTGSSSGDTSSTTSIPMVTSTSITTVDPSPSASETVSTHATEITTTTTGTGTATPSSQAGGFLRQKVTTLVLVMGVFNVALAALL